jgi:hypothetical protein
MKKFNIILRGYGSETHYIKLSQAQYDWWSEASFNEFPFGEYLEDPSSFEGYEIPDEFNFLRDEDGEFLDWKNGVSFCSFYSPSFDSCQLIVEKEDEITKEVIFDNHVSMFFDSRDTFEWDLDCEDFESECVIFVSENQKGDFFHGQVEAEAFEFSKIKIYLCEAPDGECFLTKVFYDGKEVVNANSSTIYKGLSYGFCNEI